MTSRYLTPSKMGAYSEITYSDSLGQAVPLKLEEPMQSREDLELEVRSLRLINEMQRKELAKLRARLAL